MIRSLGKRLSSPLALPFRADLKSISRWMLILRPTVVTTLIGIALLLYPSDMIDKTPPIIIVLGTFLLTLLYLLANRISGIDRSLLATQVAFDIFLITVIIHYTGATDSPFVVLYILPILCASLFFRRLVTVLYAIEALLFHALYSIGYLAFTDRFILPYERISTSVQILMYGILFIAIALFTSSYAERVGRKDSALLSALRLLKAARLDTDDILQSMTNGLITVSTTGAIIYINRAAEHLLGIRDRSAQGMQYTLMLTLRAPDMADAITESLSHGRPIDEREIIVRDDHGRAIPIGMTVVPLYDADRSRRGVIINFKDLTEKIKLMEMIRQSERMAAIGHLAASIAHEIRNPLASIGNVVELLKDHSTSSREPVPQLLSILEHESDRLQRISTDFLTFARVRDPEPRPVSLVAIIDDVLLLIANDPRNTPGVIITRRVHPELMVVIDPDHFKQIMLNISINALDVLKGSGEIVIYSEVTDPEHPTWVRIVMYDTGPGFSPEALDHLFEPFYSTKPGGTGLGLALVRKLVIGNNGRIVAANRPGAGAEFVLDLPKQE